MNRAGLPVNAECDAFAEVSGNRGVDLLNELKRDGPLVWDEEPFDAIFFYTGSGVSERTQAASALRFWRKR